MLCLISRIYVLLTAQRYYVLNRHRFRRQQQRRKRSAYMVYLAAAAVSGGRIRRLALLRVMRAARRPY